ncbi:hypothetical protein Tco_0829516 [Tanacetum coccineum]
MSSESTSSQTPQCLLLPSSKVKFEHHKSIIAYNNAVALLEHHDPLYRPMLNFLSNCSISDALTKEPSAMYVGIKSLLEVTATKVCVTAAKLNTTSVKLVLLVKIEENILSSYYCLYTVIVAGVYVTTAGVKLMLLVQKLQLLKD